MKRCFCIILALVSFCLRASSQIVSLRYICDAPLLLNSRGSVQLDGSLYYLDFGNNLHKLNLATGDQQQLGKEMFLYKRWFFAVNHQLFLIRSDGSMIGIDTATGSYRILFDVMSWSDISFVVPVGKKFYTVQFQTLYHHPTVHPKPAQQVGKPAFFQVRSLLLTDSTLHTPVGDCLYRIDLQTGAWSLIKRDKELRNYLTGAVVQHRFYYIQNSGAFVEISLRNGETRVLDKEQFTRPVLFFQEGGNLYYVNNVGRLFEVMVTPPAKKGF